MNAYFSLSSRRKHVQICTHLRKRTWFSVHVANSGPLLFGPTPKLLQSSGKRNNNECCQTRFWRSQLCLFVLEHTLIITLYFMLAVYWSGARAKFLCGSNKISPLANQSILNEAQIDYNCNTKKFRLQFLCDRFCMSTKATFQFIKIGKLTPLT